MDWNALPIFALKNEETMKHSELSPSPPDEHPFKFNDNIIRVDISGYVADLVIFSGENRVSSKEKKR